MFTVENLAVRLGDKNILQNVHFTIDTPGQLVGILGANGRGKTTLLRAVAGLSAKALECHTPCRIHGRRPELWQLHTHRPGWN